MNQVHILYFIGQFHTPLLQFSTWHVKINLCEETYDPNIQKWKKRELIWIWDTAYQAVYNLHILMNESYYSYQTVESTKVSDINWCWKLFTCSQVINGNKLQSIWMPAGSITELLVALPIYAITGIASLLRPCWQLMNTLLNCKNTKSGFFNFYS